MAQFPVQASFDLTELAKQLEAVFVPKTDLYAPRLTSAPTIDDMTPVVGQTLTAKSGGVTEGAGGTHLDLWQWFRVAPSGNTFDIFGQVSASYKVSADDVQLKLGVRQQLIDAVTGIAGDTGTSLLTAVVASNGGPVPANTVLPSIEPTGSHTAGSQEYVLKAGEWTENPTSYIYSIRVNNVQQGAAVTSSLKAISYTPLADGPFGPLSISVLAANANGSDSANAVVSTSSVTISAPSGGGGAPSGGYVEITPLMWDEIEAEGAGGGTDPNAAQYRSRVAAMSTSGGTVVPPGGNIASVLHASASACAILKHGNYNVTNLELSGTRKLLVEDGAVATISASPGSKASIYITGTNHLGAAGTGVLKINNAGLGVYAEGAACKNGVIRHLVVEGGSTPGPGGITLRNGTNNLIVVSSSVKVIGAGENTDGMASAFQNTSTPARNAFIGCYVYKAPDDGYDLWSSTWQQSLYFCRAEECGKSPYQNANGHGFKLGGNGASVKHNLYRCDSKNNLRGGYNRNSNGVAPRLKNCTASGNQSNYLPSQSSFEIVP